MSENAPPKVKKFGVWVKFDDGSDVMIVNDNPYLFNYSIFAPPVLVDIDNHGFTKYEPSSSQNVKVEFECATSMYVSGGKEFLRQMDPSQFDPFYED